MTTTQSTTQPNAFADWENDLAGELGQALGLSRSEAGQLVDVQAETVVSAWFRRLDAKKAAGLVIEAATAQNKERAEA